MKKTAIFTEEIIRSFSECGEIDSSFDPEDVRRIVAESLLNQIRFNGICGGLPYSVMTHSFLVAALARDFAMVSGDVEETVLSETELCGLLHDVGETIVGDVIYPLKSGRFKEAYDGAYLPIEKAFRNWLSEKIYGISGFGEMWSRRRKPVEEADAFAGKMELFGVTALADWSSGEFLAPVFCEMSDRSFSRKDFDDKIDFLKKKLRKEDGQNGI